jgi:NAD-dependent SIR2 family protein deacetylase
MVNTAIFLGAGASCAEGAPSQGQLFADYFSSDTFRQSPEDMDRELATFFLEMFQIDVDHGDIRNIQFPTFEEVLGLTDLAIIRKEAFKHFDIENRAANSGRLRFIAQYLVFLVAKVLDFKLQDRALRHRNLVVALRDANELKRVAFVSTNYDILIDNALTEEHDQGKPHGSLNWLFCPTCNELEITPKEKGVVTRLISDFRNAACPRCESVYMPLIVPPTFYKDLNNVFLSTIWNKTDIALRKVQHIVFCGYSFPDADIHIKYLLKRAQTNRNAPLKFTVVNNHRGKKVDEAAQEEVRYKRFLGATVNYTTKSFEDFAADPLAVIRP